LPEVLEGADTKIIGCIHDEIILEAPEGVAREVANTLEEKMIEAGQCFLKRVPIEVDISISESWADFHK